MQTLALLREVVSLERVSPSPGWTWGADALLFKSDPLWEISRRAVSRFGQRVQRFLKTFDLKRMTVHDVGCLLPFLLMFSVPHFFLGSFCWLVGFFAGLATPPLGPD